MQAQEVRVNCSGRALMVAFFCSAAGMNSIAEAQGLFIVNYGEDIFEVGEFPPEMVSSEDTKAGYKCEVFGLLWAYFHWWNCQPVAFQEDSYDDAEKFADYVRENFKESDMKLGTWQQHGRWLFAFGVLLLIISIIRNRGAPTGYEPGEFVYYDDEDEGADSSDKDVA